MHQFSRDAGVAEAWLLGQEPYLSSREMGRSVDEVEKLIKRHEAFEKSAATWEERFSALERLTTVSTGDTPAGGRGFLRGSANHSCCFVSCSWSCWRCGDSRRRRRGRRGLHLWRWRLLRRRRSLSSTGECVCAHRCECVWR